MIEPNQVTLYKDTLDEDETCWIVRIGDTDEGNWIELGRIIQDDGTDLWSARDPSGFNKVENLLDIHEAIMHLVDVYNEVQ